MKKGQYLKESFGANVRHHRRARGLSQDALAELIDVSIETIGKIERGVAAPSFDTLERLGSALKVPTAVFFGGVEKAVLSSERGRLVSQINTTLSKLNEKQLARAARLLRVFAEP